MSAPKFAPWIQQSIGGLLLIFLGSMAVYLANTELMYATFVGIVIFFVGFKMIINATSRERGKRVEKDSIDALEIPNGWLCESNIILRSGGDLDLLLTSPEKNQFAIEIKSFAGVILKTQWMTGRESLAKLNGSRINPEPLQQVRHAASEFGATPVVWLPASKQNKVLRLRCGAIVVQGPQRLLKHAIGLV